MEIDLSKELKNKLIETLLNQDIHDALDTLETDLETLVGDYITSKVESMNDAALMEHINNCF